MADVLDAERLWSIPRVGVAAVGGGRVVVPVTTHDLDENVGTTRLWEVHLDGRPLRALTSTTASATKPVISPDGARLAFLRKVDGRQQVHVMALDGGEADGVTDLPLGAIGARWMPDGRHLVVVANVYRDHPDLDATRAERDRLADTKVTAHVTEDARFRHWDRWLTNGEVPHLLLVAADASTGTSAGAEVRDLTPSSMRWMRWDNTGDPLDDVDVSPDGSTVAWCANRSGPPHTQVRWSLFVTDVATGDERCLTPDHEGHASHPRFRPDGTGLVYGKTYDPRFYADRVRLVAHELATGEERTLAADWDRSPTNWSFDGDDLVFEAEDDARQPIWRLRGDGPPTEVARDGTLVGVSPLGDGTLVATRSSLTRPPELVRVVADGIITPLTDVTAEAMAGLELPTVEDVRFAGARRDEVQMFVVSAPGLDDGPAPLVHVIHGGPHGTFGDTWHWRWNTMAFVGRHLRAALVNFHGSTSFGQDYAASIRGAWGDLPAADIEAATDVLFDRGLADPERMAIMGGSYGGYLVSWLIGRTDRYRCAIAHAAVTNLANMYATDGTEGLGEAHGAVPWDDLDRVQRWSPMAHAGGFSTPTLVIHGDRDHRVPVGQGLELYGVLKAKGVDARLVHYPDENHWILSPANSIHWYGEVAAWLTRHL
ncbi:MAG: S9 family peptidase [Actinomycetota bacterium]|nr:S9 family peptidase [Actinomycetota bacterium]